MAAKPKVGGWPPKWIASAYDGKHTRGAELIEFGEHYCRLTKESVAGNAGDLIQFRPWQKELFKHLLAERPDGRLAHRVALIGVARKNGKSAMAVPLGMWSLMLGPAGGEIYSCAADRDQARIVFGQARRTVELDRELSANCKVFRDVIEVPSTGSIWRVLSAEAYTKEGLSPTMVLFDEVHAQPSDELWNVMALAQGARTEPLMVGVTTAGVRTDSTGQDSICYRLYQHGQRIAAGEVDDPTFMMAWWEPSNPLADHRDPTVWRESNPGFGDIVSVEDFESAVKRTPEAEFRTKRTNVFVASATSWLPTGVFEALGGGDPIPDGVEVVLGFDGSYDGDCTGIVAATVGSEPRLEVVELWERPQDDPGWRVPISEVEQAIRDACARWRVVEIACDPFRWARSMQALEEEGWPIIEWPTSSPGRMVPACATFYDLVMDEKLVHSGDPRLERHFRNCVVKRDRLGARIVKDARGSSRKIDLAVCAVIAVDRATRHVPQARKAVFSY